MSDSDDDVVKPPERRAPSGRASKGNRMQALIAHEEDEDADEGDKEFYEQEFWAEAEEDIDYAGAEADDEDAVDSFDSDFGDSTESDDDDDDDNEKAARAKDKPAKKASKDKDPKAGAAGRQRRGQRRGRRGGSGEGRGGGGGEGAASKEERAVGRQRRGLLRVL